MGGSDTHCYLTGSRYFSREEIRDGILEVANYDASDLSEKVMEGLLYTEEDAQASMQYVLICPYDRDDEGNIKLRADFEDERPSENTPDMIMAVYNVIPGSDPSYGAYESEDPEEWDEGYYSVINGAPTMIITHSAYLILKGAAPLLQPHIIYELNFGKPGEEYGKGRIDLGPTQGIMESQYTFWPGLCGMTEMDIEDGDDEDDESKENEDDEENPRNPWRSILSTKGRTDEAVLEDCWKGRGNMWALVRPDRFPIQETMTAVAAELPLQQSQLDQTRTTSHPSLDSLQLDILLLICELLHPRDIQALIGACKFTYLKLHRHVNHIIYTYIKQNEPWFLPVGPFDIPKGDDEVRWWNEQWGEHGIQGEGMNLQIPWLHYRRACSHNISMWNRIRIWTIAQGLEKTAKEIELIL